MRRSHSSLAALMAIAALGVAQIPGGAADPVAQTRQEARAPKAQTDRSTSTAQQAVTSQDAAFLNWWGHRRAISKRGYPDGPGWSNRQVQRMARKRRNQARHRKACRG